MLRDASEMKTILALVFLGVVVDAGAAPILNVMPPNKVMSKLTLNDMFKFFHSLHIMVDSYLRLAVTPD